MKLASLREFIGGSLSEVVNYLTSDHNANLKELRTVLGRLSLIDNFESFEVSVVIPATSEVGIENKLRGQIPSKRIIVRGDSNDVVDGATAWTKEFVYMRNLGASAATVTIVFLK